MTRHHHFKEPFDPQQSSFPSADAEIFQRVRCLERQLRRMRIGVFLILSVVGIALISGAGALQETAAEIRARRFAVVDDQGRVKAYIGHTGTSTSLQIGADGHGIRMEHGAHTNAIQLITPAHVEAEEEGFQSNSLTLHNDPYNTGVLIINPGTRADGNSRGRVWLSTLKGFELSRDMF